MRIATPLFIPPILFLVLVAVAYAMVPWECEAQRRFPVHLVSLIALAIAGGCVYLAWRNWASLGVQPTYDQPDITTWVRFLAVLGLVLSGLSTIGTLMLLVSQIILPPCVR